MVVEIVRTCQSTVARNFHLAIAPTPSANNRTQSPSQATASIRSAVHMHEEPAEVPMDGTAGSAPEFFPEPSQFNSEANTSLPANLQLESVTEIQTQDPESGYAGFPCSCGCSCHDYSNNWNTANGEKLSKCNLEMQLMKITRPVQLSVLRILAFRFR